MKRLPRKSLLAVVSVLLFAACATMGPPQPPSLELPKPPSDLRARRKGDRVALTWTAPSTTTDRQTIRRLGTSKICRAMAISMTECGAPVAEVARDVSSAQNPAMSYTDTLPASLESNDPSAFAAYAVDVFNASGRSAGLSNQVRVSLARTLPPPQDFTARITEKGVVLTWTNEIPPTTRVQSASTPPEHYVYRVYRRAEGNSQQVMVGETPAGSEHEMTLLDSSMEWEKTYEYHADTATVITQSNQPRLEIEGDDTPEIRVFVNDVFPPAVPTGLQAVASGPGQKVFVDLVWAPVSDVDLEGYNVYRREDGTNPVKVNAELVKTPAYRDMSVTSGKRYFYSVSAVDAHGNESARSEEASENVP